MRVEIKTKIICAFTMLKLGDGRKAIYYTILFLHMSEIVHNKEVCLFLF